VLGVAAEADGVRVQVHSVHILRQVVQVKEPAKRACHDIFENIINRGEKSPK
jgi:hypothetical protein